MKIKIKLIILIINVIFFTSEDIQAQLDIENTNHDISQVIDISSRTLTVKAKENIAIFSGSVVVIQGDLQMIAEEMIVNYSTDSDSQRGAGKISSIKSKGNFELTIPGKMAKSDEGVYNIDEDLIVLTGNVVLNRGVNKLYGSKFIYNAATGTSQMLGQEVLTSSANKKKGSVRKKRVRGVFSLKKKPSKLKSKRKIRKSSTKNTRSYKEKYATIPKSQIPTPVRKPLRFY